MNENEKVRQELLEYVKENGVKMKFIAEKVNIPTGTFSRWKHKNFDFRIDKLIRIKKFLNESKKQN